MLSPVRTDWAQPAFQATLASPQAFITHYLPLEADPAGGYQVGRQLASLGPGCAAWCDLARQDSAGRYI